ncbi:MAG: FKBP-type peptidyl-prolyl cis-trans isomerase [Opitutaceae bacterium]|nr:FKBP-type peptidyl-prolyl cis-trans isomerase [Opitutaceae bacterium]
MRYPLFFALALSTATLRAADAPAAAPAAPTPAPEPAAPAPAPVAPATAEQAFKVQGFFMVQQMQLASMTTELGMNDADIDYLLAGMRLALKGQELGFTPESIGPGLSAFFQARVAANASIVAAAKAAKAKEAEAKALEAAAAGVAFFAKIDADTTVTKTASGLRYRILAAGTDPKPAATSTVKALYTGKLTDGTVFDSTDKNGGQPLEFSLGGVIKGWTEGLQLIGKGGKIHLWVPSDLGYGARSMGEIPANSVLEFDVELVDFK